MRRIQARNYTKGRITAVKWIVIHCMEAPDKPDTAEKVAQWFAGPNAPRASAHYCVDSDSIVECVAPEDTAWHAPGANAAGIGIELAGYAAQSTEQWGAPMLAQARALVADLCARFGVPNVYRDVEALKAGLAGVTTHRDVSLAFHKSTHTDPGKNFPIASVTSLAQPDVDEPTWYQLPSGVYVTGDAIKVNGVRIVGNARIASGIARLFNATLWTPEVSDEAFRHADVRLDPVTLPGCPTDATSVRKHSELLDVQIMGRVGLIAPTGKQWVLPRGDKPLDKAAIYGWQVEMVRTYNGEATWRGIPVYPAATGLGLHVIQPEQYGHNLLHEDYSMFIRLMRGPVPTHRRMGY